MPCACGLVLVGQRLALRASARPYEMHVTMPKVRVPMKGARACFYNYFIVKVGFLTTLWFFN
jgi:hypothetical protein